MATFGAWLELVKGFKAATVKQNVAIMGWWHAINGHEDPSKQLMVRKYLEGLRKKSPPSKQADPIRYPLLVKLLKALPKIAQGQELRLLRAVFLLAYHASLRVSEYAATPAGHALKLEDLTFYAVKKGLKAAVKLRSFKNSRKPSKLLVGSSPDPSLCPVTALLEYVAGRGSDHSELFQRVTKKGPAPLSPAWVNKKIRECVAAAGLPPGRYSSHSFRAGRTTDLVAMNYDDATIRESGRWRSMAYLEYVRFNLFALPEACPAVLEI